MSQQTVRLGYIGAGRFSRRRLLPALQSIPGVELAAVCNSTPESSQRVAQEFGFHRVASDWKELASSPDIDAVVIGTRPNLHRDMCLFALDAEKHVLTLNAISPTLEEARDMQQKAEEKPHLTALVYPGQFYLREDDLMRSLLEEGYVGQVIHVRVYWSTLFFGLGTQFDAARRWFGEHTRVFAYRKSLDIQVPATGQSAGTARADTNLVVAELENGVTVTYLHSTPARGTNRARFEVYGSAGVLVCYSYGQDKEGIFGAKAGESDLRPIVVPPHMQEAWAYPDGSIPVEAAFIASIREGKAPSPAVTRFRDGVKLMEFVQAWGYSMDHGVWSDVPVT
ncbi:MAG: Gfo/Idh/MocA family oxidoreductase [Chloroflexi bacterium]|nr:Gfo/Idh/MocA family oxidoreductase [Chloroflexota bacterium]